MGIENEYGIVAPALPGVDSRELSRRVIAAYAGVLRARGIADDIRWDYLGERPLQDVRGFVHARDEVDPSLLTDDPSQPAPSGPRPEDLMGGDDRRPHAVPRLTELARQAARGTSTVLPNGARLYIDHGHPEYATPETTTPRGAVRVDLAGDLAMVRAMDALRQGGSPEVVLYRNNQDGKGSAYGCHENYIVDRAVPFDTLVAALVPFFVTRSIMVGSGRVGLDPRSSEPGFQLSQRADFIETLIGIQTTLNRPLVNTRDEPHADSTRWRRLHVICGDANCAPASTLLKLGTMSLVLAVLERRGLPEEWATLELADPVGDVVRVSRDLSLSEPLLLADGSRRTALEIQRAYLDVVTREVRGTAAAPDPDTADILQRWERTLTDLAGGWQNAVGSVEWAAKLALLEARRARDGLGWSAPELAAMDLQWSDLRPERSLSARLRGLGRLEEVVPQAEVAAAEFAPPSDTRAWFRGELIRRFPERIFSASWQSIVVDLSDTPGVPAPTRSNDWQGGGMVRIPLANPVGGTRDRVAALLDDAADLADLVATLAPPATPPATPSR
ncbi:MAG: proteasome accessory factor PafA2 [Actinobacteria bacterium]|nr:proteasome accessory factor PafA2 [Actinomycetota bacterium]